MPWTRPFCHAGFVSEPAGGPPSRVWTRLVCAAATAGLGLGPAGSAAPGPAHAPSGAAAPAETAAGWPGASPTAATETAADPGRPSTICQVSDPRLPELSGL